MTRYRNRAVPDVQPFRRQSEVAFPAVRRRVWAARLPVRAEADHSPKRRHRKVKEISIYIRL